MKRFLSLLLLSAILLGCSQSAKQEHTRTPNVTKHSVTTSKQIVTPPPAVMTPLPPEHYIGEFVRYFNERNATGLYELFSERVRLNHSIKEFEDALKFAEKNDIKIVNWKVVGSRFSPKAVTVSFKIIVKNVTKNKTITFPFLYKRCKITVDGKTINHTVIYFTGYIDGWIIRDVIN